MNKFMIFNLLATAFVSYQVQANEQKCEINASLFMLANFTNDSSNYGHVNLSYVVSQKSSVGIEFLTWEYSEPLAVTYADKGDPREAFPGYVKGTGLGITYQHFITPKLFLKAHAAPMHQRYVDEGGELIQTGWQLFLQARVGYRWTWFEGAVFLEPSVAATSWPIENNMPDSFLDYEEKWQSFTVEPGLNVGFRF